MAAALQHRGPDDHGTWADPAAGIGLGHRRLAIQDLSMEGHQPMHSSDGRFVLIFNGEIYNFQDLKAQLENRGHTFRGHSDTEVMLATFTEYGVERGVEQFLGMFAFALWDRQTRQLHLARDRAGEKPLYYGWSRGVFLFGSELKALRAHPAWRSELDPAAITLFLRHNYIPCPYSVYRNISKLPPGSILSLNSARFARFETFTPQTYWRLWDAVERGVANPFAGDADAAVAKATALLSDSVSRQMISDVPLGAFLSGGIDSSTIVALMQRRSTRPVKTFSIGFTNPSHDEAPFAKAVAQHLGTDHTEFYVDPATLLNAVPRLAHVYDEPFADTSNIPTVLLCELARKNVTVCLSGDGGDELFGGYALYRKTEQLWKAISKLPTVLRTQISQGLHRAATLGITGATRVGANPRFLKRILRLSELLPSGSDRHLYRLLSSTCRFPQEWLRDPTDQTCAADARWEQLPALLPRMMYSDFISYLPDEILVKVDRAAMSVSLETRIPLLDHRIVEFAWSLPVSLKQNNGQGKWLLRQVLQQYLPRHLFDRPKQGFTAPVEEWIRGKLRDWAEDMLADSKLRQSGLFQERSVRQKWSEHCSRERDWGRPLWNILMLQAWLESHRASTAAPVREMPVEPQQSDCPVSSPALSLS
jgi:asparagine synthase (glutamine-hydrolysing)